jgi:hypothetical protein
LASEVGADPFSILGSSKSKLFSDSSDLARTALTPDVDCEARYAAIWRAEAHHLTTSPASRDDVLRSPGAPTSAVTTLNV